MAKTKRRRKPGAKRVTKSRKRSLAAKKAARTRKARKLARSMSAKKAARRRKRTGSRRKRNPWYGEPERHAKAARLGWRRRRKGKKVGTKRRRRKATAAPRKRRATKRTTAPRKRRAVGGRKSSRRAAAARKGWATRRSRRAAPHYHSGARGYAGGMAAWKARQGGGSAHYTGTGYNDKATAFAKSRRRKARKGRKGRKRNAAYRRRYRRNDGGLMGGLKTAIKLALPAAVALYGARFLQGKLVNAATAAVAAVAPTATSGIFPAAVPQRIQGPIVAAALLAAGHFATSKVAALRSHRVGIMLGLGVNLIDRLISAFMPASVSSAIGVGEYVSLSDYLMTGGGRPINDSITMSDYVSVGEYGELEQDLGLDQDLGVEQDLGMLQQDLGSNIGGVGRDALVGPVPTRAFVGPVPSRSFVSQVPSITDAFDNPDRLYAGMFAGGFGN